MPEKPAVPVDAAAGSIGPDPDREYSPADLFVWHRTETPLVRVQTAEDALPGGLSMAMAPLLVDWEGSSVGHGPDDFYLVHNVNVSANPIEGTTVLATVRVPAAAIQRAEFVLVITKLGRFKTKLGHAMLRFVFGPDARPVILDHRGRPVANRSKVPDLVLSWEAWRPPTANFEPLAGLDPQTYTLTPRCSSGPVRCLSDSVLDRPWVSYPLQLPDVPHAAADLLYIALLLGDALARQTIAQLLNVEVKGQEEAAARARAEKEDLEDAEEALDESGIPANPIRDILDGNVTYHLLLRSCITLALATVDWAHMRICRDAGLPDPPRIRVAPESLPSAFDELADGNVKSAFLRMPAVLHWLVRNGSAMPGDSPKALEEAGLLQVEDGEVVRTEYDNRHESPYGRIDDNLIY